MNRYAVYYKTSRTVVKATNENEAYQKVAVLFGIEAAHAHKACRAFFLRNEPNSNPATGVATTPKTMSKKTTTKKASKAAAKKSMDSGVKGAKASKAKAPSKPTLGDRVEKAAHAPKKPAKEGMSGLDAACDVLKRAKEPLNAKQIVACIQNDGLAAGLKGLTPHATIYAAMITEITKKGAQSRFARGPQKGTFIYQEPAAQ